MLRWSDCGAEAATCPRTWCGLQVHGAEPGLREDPGEAGWRPKQWSWESGETKFESQLFSLAVDLRSAPYHPPYLRTRRATSLPRHRTVMRKKGNEVCEVLTTASGI